MVDNTIEMIGKLIETCRDGQAGFLEAAEHTRNAELRAYFSRQGLERAKFAAELESVARRLGEAEPGGSPSVAGKLHRAWIDLKHKMGGGDACILESVEFGQRIARNRYREALQAGLPLNVLAIVERQAESVFDAHDQVRTLEDMYRSAA